MNYLAHAYLSFNHAEIIVGNMISDFVKGKAKLNYSQGIQNGITLHRAIDEFTDVHPATKKAKEFFRPCYRLYSGAFVDVVFDHFLAIDKSEFYNSQSLQFFSQQVYNALDENIAVLPAAFKIFLPNMKLNNWLLNYQFAMGIEMSFKALVHRAAYINDAKPAFDIYSKNYNELKDCYSIFFPTLKKFANHYLNNLLLS